MTISNAQAPVKLSLDEIIEAIEQLSRTEYNILVAKLKRIGLYEMQPLPYVVQIEPGKNGDLLLRADAVLYNPNNTTVRLKEIRMNVLLDGNQAASINQKLNSLIKARSEFTIPLEVLVNMKELGLLDTILSLFGAKKHELQFTGTVRIKVSLFPVSIPINHKEEIRF